MALDGAGERLRLFKADLLDYASVAAAVAGCQGVFHVASPVPAVNPINPDVLTPSQKIHAILVQGNLTSATYVQVEILAPAVAGTKNVLRVNYAADARRVVVV